jgi:penicillin-binding protein 1A
LVQDREGKVIFRADKRDCVRCDAGFNGDESPRIPALGEQVMDPITAYQITSMLQGVVQRGTAAQASSLGYPLAGKTGTTNEYRSAWFMGYSPNLVVGVFIGFDDNRSLGEGETGATGRADLHGLHARGAGGPAEDRVQGAQERQVRHGARHPRGLPPRHRAQGRGRCRPRAPDPSPMATPGPAADWTGPDPGPTKPPPQAIPTSAGSTNRRQSP